MVTTPSVCADVEKRDCSYIAGGYVTWYSHPGKRFSRFLKNKQTTNHPTSMWWVSCIPRHLSPKNKDMFTQKPVYKNKFVIASS